MMTPAANMKLRVGDRRTCPEHRSDCTRAPSGRQSIAGGVSPRKKRNDTTSPGRAEDARTSVAPSGRCDTHCDLRGGATPVAISEPAYPWLSSFRPCGLARASPNTPPAPEGGQLLARGANPWENDRNMTPEPRRGGSRAAGRPSASRLRRPCSGDTRSPQTEWFGCRGTNWRSDTETISQVRLLSPFQG